MSDGYTPGNEPELAMELDGFRYSWTGGLTVNVWGQGRDGRWCNFDCFTFGDEVAGRVAAAAAIEEHHAEMVGDDPPDVRYVTPRPTRRFLIGGYDRDM